MATVVTPAIPASQIVSVTPGVLAAGGTALDLSGMMLTNSTRIPIGSLLQFPNDGRSLSSYFGATAPQTALGTIYFNGFDNSNKKPSVLYAYQYPWQQPVAAWLRGGSVSSLTLAQLQALSGTLTVTIDGVAKSASISLANATSFSNAALLIASGLGITGPNIGSFTGSIAATTMTISAQANGQQQASFVGSISGTTLTVTTLNSGYIAVGLLLTNGTGIVAGTTITALGSGVGGIGTYTVSPTQTLSSTTITAFSTLGSLAVGDVVSGTGITANTYISALVSGTGGTGTYTVSPSQTAGSETITAFGPAVVYDSIFGAFQINSGTLGASSTISFGSGALATSLNLTQALGAVTSQGAAQSTPAAAMTAVTALGQNWATFFTDFEPSDADKVSFSLWNTGQNNSYHYAMWDTNLVNEGSGGPSSAVGTIVAGSYSGTSLIHEVSAIDATPGELAAFIAGYAASIDFNQTQGRATAAFKRQAGLASEVFSGTIATNLLSYSMNFLGNYTTANQAFTWYYNGSVTGQFKWLDSYVNQIWLNKQLQLSLMVLLDNIRSIPYNQYGYGLITAAIKDPVLAAVNNGVIQPGIPLSQAQAAEVNASAGLKIDSILSTIGWYIQVLPATPQVRQARGSPPCTLWYMDGQSVQQINLASIELQ